MQSRMSAGRDRFGPVTAQWQPAEAGHQVGHSPVRAQAQHGVVRADLGSVQATVTRYSRNGNQPRPDRYAVRFEDRNPASGRVWRRIVGTYGTLDAAREALYRAVAEWFGVPAERWRMLG